jgi:hypothetical protein
LTCAAESDACVACHVDLELAKCVLLCANCHRETHAGLRSFAGDHRIGEMAGRYRIRGEPAAA